MNGAIKKCMASSLALLVTTPGFGRSYVVKKGDTLSEIVYAEIGGPVWGKTGTLQKVLVLNPNIDNPDLIYPNQVIILSVDEDKAVAVIAEPVEEEPYTPVAVAPMTLGETKKSHKDEIGLLFITSDTTKDGRGADNEFESELRSKTNYGGMVTWHRSFGNDWRAGVSFKAVNSTYDAEKDGATTKESKTLKAFGAEVEKYVTKRFKVGGNLGMEQHMFVGQKSATALEMEPVFIDTVGLQAGYDFIQFTSTTAGLGIHSKYADRGKAEGFDVESGMVYGTNLYGDYKFARQYKVIGVVFYDRHVQNTDEVRDRTSEQGVRFGLGYEY